MGLYVHQIDPVAISFFGFNIYWYSLSYLFGFLLSILYSHHLIKKKLIALPIRSIDDFLSYAILGVIIGGRLGYVFFYNIDFYFSNPIEIFKIWNGGMSFHGGLIGLTLSITFFCKKNNYSFLDFSNLISSCAPIGIFLGRIANFINAELIGKPTNGNWGVVFNINDVPRHPSQLYEAFFEGLIIFFLIYFLYLKGFSKKINFFALFLIMYSISRFLIEFIREPDEHLGYLFFNLTMGQLLCLPMFLVGIIFLKYGKRN